MIKYRLSYRADDDVAWKVEISNVDYTGDVINIRGISRQACTITWTPTETDDPFCHVFKSNADIAVYNQGQIDVTELQKAEDKDFIVEVYRGGNLFWKGYLIPDGIQGNQKSGPSELTISATDGLSLLDEMIYYHNNLPGLTSDPTRCIMNYFRQILFANNNLGIALPIYWTNTLECTQFTGHDMFTEFVTWSARGEGFFSFQPNGETKKCMYILAGMLKSVQARIFQCEGKWIIRRVNDIVTGSFTSKHIAADLGPMTVVTETIDVNKNINLTGYRPVNENAVTTVRKGVATCKTTYEANVRENILPNGSQDIVSFSTPIYWTLSGDGTYTSVGAIDGRDGYATEITNPVGVSVDPSVYSTYPVSIGGNSGLPIDSYTLVKRINFGFIFSPQNGFPYDSSTGIIDFSGKPFKIRIKYICLTATYYLDEFAIWRTDPTTTISIEVQGLKINDIVQVDFNRNNAIIIPKPASQPEAFNICTLEVDFLVNDGQKYTLDYIYFKTDENNDVYESTISGTKNTAIDERTLEISSSYGGYFLSNYQTAWSESYRECFYKDGSFYTGTLTGLNSNAIMRFLYAASVIYNGSVYVANKNWSFDEIYTIAGQEGKFLPLNATYSTEIAQVSLVAIECRNDDVSLTEKHYGSNDQTLSN